MKKIKFFSSYCSEEQIYNNIISSWGMGSSFYKNLSITKDDDYDYAVLFNTGMCNKKLPKENILGFSHEPRMTLGMNDFNQSYIENSVSEYYISNNSGLSGSFKEGFSFVCPFEYGKSKNEKYNHVNKMSMILSVSNFMPGHKMRHDLLKMILDSDLDIHFYANGLNRIYSDSRVKEFDWDIFGKPYEDYKYQIVIENIIDNNWSTEKLTNCIIKETIPIYYGSRNCSSIFYPEGSINHLGNDIHKNFEIISEIYKNSIYDSELTKKAKDKLYKEVNLLEFLNVKLNRY
jgi:hypothetical protein